MSGRAGAALPPFPRHGRSPLGGGDAFGRTGLADARCGRRRRCARFSGLSSGPRRPAAPALASRMRGGGRDRGRPIGPSSADARGRVSDAGVRLVEEAGSQPAPAADRDGARLRTGACLASRAASGRAVRKARPRAGQHRPAAAPDPAGAIRGARAPTGGTPFRDKGSRRAAAPKCRAPLPRPCAGCGLAGGRTPGPWPARAASGSA